MNQVLYEVHYQFEAHAFIPVIMLVLIPFFPRMHKRKCGEPVPGGTKVFLAVVWCIVLAVAILVGTHQIQLYRTVTAAYKNGDYQIVEGFVENFDPMPPEGHKTESFDINGVHFSYADAQVMTGYHNAKCNGGVITGNGQYLKIGYIYYGSSYGNIIVYIEELPPT